MKILLFGREGKVGAVLMHALDVAGHDVTGVEVGEVVDAAGFDAAVDFTAPAAVHDARAERPSSSRHRSPRRRWRAPATVHGGHYASQASVAFNVSSSTLGQQA